jgi:signal peptidase II
VSTPNPILSRKPGVTRWGWTALAVAALVVLADQASKFWVLNVFQLPLRGSEPVAGPFHLTMVWNRGVSFGLFRADQDLMRWALAGFSAAVAFFLTGWAFKAKRPLLGVALGLVVGGAAGNLIDRVRFAAVADFLDFSRLYFPWVFNVADAGITVGVVLLLIDSVLSEQAAKTRAGTDAAARDVGV